MPKSVIECDRNTHPSLSLLKIFSESFSVSFEHLENIFVALIAILIEVISTYLMIVNLTTKTTSQNQFFQVSETFSERTEILKDTCIIKPCEVTESELVNPHKSTSETPKKHSDYSKSFLEKYEKVFCNVKNKIYEPKITQIMANEKIGYPMAKQILNILQEQS